VFCAVGMSRELQSDRGSNYTALLMREIMKLAGVKQVHGSSYHAAAQGQVERFNGTLVQMLSAYANDSPNEYTDYVEHCVFAYNTAVHPAIRETPYFTLYGRDPLTPFEAISTLSSEKIHEAGDFLRGVQRARESAAENIKKAQAAYERYANEGRSPTIFEIGDLVRYKIQFPDSKLAYKWSQAHKVIGKFNDNYEIEPLEPDPTYKGKRWKLVDSLKPVYDSSGKKTSIEKSKEDEERDLFWKGLESGDILLDPKDDGQEIERKEKMRERKKKKDTTSGSGEWDVQEIDEKTEEKEVQHEKISSTGGSGDWQVEENGEENERLRNQPKGEDERKKAKMKKNKQEVGEKEQEDIILSSDDEKLPPFHGFEKETNGKRIKKAEASQLPAESGESESEMPPLEKQKERESSQESESEDEMPILERESTSPEITIRSDWLDIYWTMSQTQIPTEFRRCLDICHTERKDDEEIEEFWGTLTEKSNETLAEYKRRMKYLLWLEEGKQWEEVKADQIRNASLSKEKDGNWKVKVTCRNKSFRDLEVGEMVRLLIQLKSEATRTNVKAKVLEKGFRHLIVKIPGVNSSEIGEKTTVDVSFCPRMGQFEAEHLALNLLSEEQWRSRFRPTENCARHDNKKHWKLKEDRQSESLNQQQRKALQSIINKTSGTAPFVLIGPPGTGKTKTIIELIRQLQMKDPNVRCIICTPSNIAADDIAMKLLATGISNIARIYATTRDISEIPVSLLSFSNVKGHDIVATGEVTEIIKPTEFPLHKFPILVSTLGTASLLGKQATESDRVDYLIIDEAGQTTETQVLVPLPLLRATGQLVLCGDHRQLGPVLSRSLAADVGFGVSLMQHLVENNKLYKASAVQESDIRFVVQLTEHYRSVPGLVLIPNKRFYDNALIPVRHQQQKSFPIEVHSVYGLDEKERYGSSRSNVQEQQQVLFILQQQRFLHPNASIAILTPYSAQADAIFLPVAEKGLGKRVKIANIEMMQGQEADIVIISTVKSDNRDRKFDRKCRLDFVAHPKRFNVMVTRARNRMLIVGNPWTLATDVNWASLLSLCCEHDTVHNVNKSALQKKIARMWN
jgi:AAA domain